MSPVTCAAGQQRKGITVCLEENADKFGETTITISNRSAVYVTRLDLSTLTSIGENSSISRLCVTVSPSATGGTTCR